MDHTWFAMIRACLLMIVLQSWTIGCSTHAKRLAVPRASFYEGRIHEAHDQLSQIQRKHERDRDVVELDLAIVDLMSGRFKVAERRLREVRDRFDHFEQASLAEDSLSLWTDDQSRSYAGEDYEKVIIRTFLAITSLMSDGLDAESYSLQINEKQQRLAEIAFEKYGETFAERYRPVPFGYYLRGIIREASWRDYDDAQRAYEAALWAQPEAEFLVEDIERAKHGVHCSSNSGVVHVIALVGRGPHKSESVEKATSDALLLADRIVSAIGKYSVPPTLAPIKIPKITAPSMVIDQIGINWNGQTVAATATITDLHELALNSYEAKRNVLMARAIARRVVKKGTVYATKQALGSNQLASLALDAAGVAWEATESADTRCWGLLPREIQVARLELPSGPHRISLAPLRMGSPIAPARELQINIKDGADVYVLAYFPGPEPIGQILIGPNR